MGISAKVDDLARLLPSKLVIFIRARIVDTRSFSVAHMRFVDMEPLAIDHEMVRRMECGLHEALPDGLQVMGEDVHERCIAMLQESGVIASKRQEQSKNLERLFAAPT
ncbi:hypothetical protein BKA82DRAFT_998687 [Pisolithus tinctorius]|uniref:GED domain-containing protein n=1 Tax=Pisolithus tinctorius Marx 270 TaxID=870435 RepID=A0A0C3P0E8_PISTI|nr:hypothetical protein BKA82DRAFT_998687 [Pisolithus tinctorius]KIO06570.1 hypothetical protein M404DRAFT_998687 [Pisolithus tinctorius Marx 270]